MQERGQFKTGGGEQGIPQQHSRLALILCVSAWTLSQQNTEHGTVRKMLLSYLQFSLTGYVVRMLRVSVPSRHADVTDFIGAEKAIVCDMSKTDITWEIFPLL